MSAMRAPTAGPVIPPPGDDDDRCVQCNEPSRRYMAVRVGREGFRLICHACADAAGQHPGALPCHGCNAPARLVTMVGKRVICAECRKAGRS